MKKALLYFVIFLALYVGMTVLFLCGLMLYAYMAGVPSDPLLDAPWVEDVGLFLAFAGILAYFIRRPEVRRMLTARQTGVGKACALAALATLCIQFIESPLANAFGLDEAVNKSNPFASGSVLILFTGCLLGPFVEEIVFRGAMTGSLLDKRHNIIVTLAVPSLLFAAVHLISELTPFYFTYGLITGWFAVRTGSLWPPIVLHATNNIICAIPGSVLPGAEMPGGTTTTALQWTLAAIAAASLTLCIIALNRITKTRKSASYK